MLPSRGPYIPGYLPPGSTTGRGLSKGLRRCCLICGVVSTTLFTLIVVLVAAFLVTSPYRARYDLQESQSPVSLSGHLPSGMRYTVVPHGMTPAAASALGANAGRVAVLIDVQVGSVDEEPSELGIAHMLEHMAFDASEQFPGRAGVWKAIMKTLGCQFNAFTSFRNTVYMLWDLEESRLPAALQIMSQQVLFTAVHDQNLQIEKGAVLSEGRFRNESSSEALQQTLLAHGGDGWRIPQRFPIGKPSVIDSWKDQHVTGFRNKWYHPSRMHVIVTGFDKTAVDAAALLLKGSPLGDSLSSSLERTSGVGPAPRPPLGLPPRRPPVDSFRIQSIDTFDATWINVLATRPWRPHPHTSNSMRVDTASKLFSLLYSVNAMARFLLEGRDIMSMDRIAGSIVSNEYQLGVEARIFSVSSPGSSTWKEDLASSLFELKRMATVGPNQTVLTVLMYVLQLVFYGLEFLGEMVDPLTLAMLVLGDMSPDAPYLDFHQLREMQNQFLDYGFVESASAHIQTEAQLMYTSILSIAGIDIDEGSPIGGGESMKQRDGLTNCSIQVIHGGGSTSSSSRIIREDIAEIIRYVHSTVDPMLLTEPIVAILNDASVLSAGPSSERLVVDHRVWPQPDTAQSGAASFKMLSHSIEQFSLSNNVPVNVHPMEQSTNGQLHLRVTSLAWVLAEHQAEMCALVNAVPWSSVFASTRIVARQAAEGPGSEALDPAAASWIRVSCGSDDMLRVDVPLHGVCIGDTSQCIARESAILQSQLLALRMLFLGVAPVWDSDLDPLRQSVLLLKETAGDAREPLSELSRLMALRLIDAEVLLAMADPSLVVQYVSLLLSSGKVEINIAGSLSLEEKSSSFALVASINRFLGDLGIAGSSSSPSLSLPDRLELYSFRLPATSPSSSPASSKKTLVLLNVHSASNKDALQKRPHRVRPTMFVQDDVQSVAVPSFSPDRAFVAMVANAPRWSSNGHNALLDGYLRILMFDSLRRDHGFTYFVMVKSVCRSVVTLSDSYMSFVWAPKPEIVKPSVSQALATMQNPRSDAQDVMERLAVSVENVYAAQRKSSPSFVVDQFEGISLVAPVTWMPDAGGAMWLREMEGWDDIPLTLQQAQDSPDVLQKELQAAVQHYSAIAVVTIPN